MNKIEKSRQDVLFDLKWQKFLKKTWLFKYIPFVEGVFGSGSIALGNVTENSDFDVLILAKKNRIFSARFFAAIILSLFGIRRTKAHHHGQAKDKVCLNHFVTPETYRLTLEPNKYWQELYSRLIPLYGKDTLIKKFFKANESWLGKIEYFGDLRHLHKTPTKLKLYIEKLFSGSWGNWFERFIKFLQIRKIERGVGRAGSGKAHKIDFGGKNKVTYKLPALIKYSDDELEFHPDPIIVRIGE